MNAEGKSNFNNRVGEMGKYLMGIYLRENEKGTISRPRLQVMILRKSKEITIFLRLDK